MKTTNLIALLMLSATMTLSSCGSKTEEKTETPAAPRAAVIEDSEEALKEDISNTYDVKAGEKTYKVTIRRYSDTEKPSFKDEFGDEFYDNRVVVTIQRDTTTLAHREFSLESFESYIPAKYKGKVILQGIAPDEQRCTPNGIVFGVTIGEAGSDEGQVLLMLTIVPGSGDVDIRKDDTPDNIGMSQEKEGR
ncbi:MAG: DUF4738 domain-containing protein [Bacteroidaceae bacterium]|nr:DUF4738 domain-containing protein [Bacteroidaceae bacterium]